ncbi:ABC transporter permease [Corynebacterium doosanense]|uniref:ABC transporter permease n=1 Tax=Corynebacterium doosanense CAU 212 = DSM 45436 TaxID=558173 RepID=A0A097II18_9CORY|nr:FtsX-like permease family protein [Corynebacterium doosanense]AIT61761.1 ABC transporter permease [Corynebacterium doosanense CAU 212 = DSM 45436]
MAQNTMRNVSLRNIAAHKLRLALTVLAVVLGTAFISGAFMFTNSLSNTFDSAVSSAYDDVDAVVSGGPTIEQRDEIVGNELVNNVNITASTTVVMAKGDADNPEPLQTGAGTQTLSVWYPSDDAVGQAPELVEGEEPSGDAEMAINAAAAEKFEVGVGDTLLVVDPMERREMTVSGLYETELDQGGSLIGLMDEQSYLDRYTPGGQVDQLIVDAVDSTSPQELVDALSADYPDLEVETGEALADEISEQIQSALSFVNYFLIAFGLVALLVGTFLIANTFSMIVAQRTKEFALLRALGASRGQITRSVTFEAAIIGFIGSVIGVIAGIGLVAAIKAVMSAQEMALPDSGLGLSPAAILVPVVLGTVVTVLSAWAPARRAGAIEPVEAMRSSESSTSQPLAVRTIFGAVLLVVGIAAAAIGAALTDWSTTQRAIAVGVGALSIFIGFFLAGPALSLPVVPTFGRVIGLPFGSIGKLASTNTRRNPRRTATTAFALALGVALVTAIGMLGSTMQKSIADTIENDVAAEHILMGPTNGSFPIPAEVPDAAAEADGVGEVITYSNAQVAVDGVFTYDYAPGVGASDVVSGNPAHMVTFDMKEGDSDISDGGMLASEKFAAEHGWEVGQTYEVTAPGVSPDAAETELVGIYRENSLFAHNIISEADALKVLPAEMISPAFMGANGDGSLDESEVRSNLEEAVAPYIVVQVMTGEEMAGEANMAITQMLNILYALLALAVIIAVLGIVNTLTLSVIERRQEIGMLRAVGTLRGQVRTMITLESVQIAVFGAIAGVLIGLGLGWAFITVLSGEGLEDPVIPWPLIGIVLAGSVVVGLLAAVFPANRAAKTPALDAISE